VSDVSRLSFRDRFAIEVMRYVERKRHLGEILLGAYQEVSLAQCMMQSVCGNSSDFVFFVLKFYQLLSRARGPSASWLGGRYVLVIVLGK